LLILYLHVYKKTPADRPRPFELLANPFMTKYLNEHPRVPIDILVKINSVLQANIPSAPISDVRKGPPQAPPVPKNDKYDKKGEDKKREKEEKEREKEREKEEKEREKEREKEEKERDKEREREKEREKEEKVREKKKEIKKKR